MPTLRSIQRFIMSTTAPPVSLHLHRPHFEVRLYRSRKSAA